MEHTEASNVLKKSYLEKSLQEARLGYAEATDPTIKASFLKDAISAQKAITDINVSEVKARIVAFEDQYKTLAGLDEESSGLLITNLRKIAGNYEAFFGKNGQMALLQIQKETFAWKDQLGLLTKVERAQYNQVRAAVANLEIFSQLQNNLEPGVFMEYVKTLGEFNNAIAAGDQSLFRLTKTLTTVEGKISGFKKVTGTQPISIGNIKMPSFSSDVTPDKLMPVLDWEKIISQEKMKKFNEDFSNMMYNLRDTAVNVGGQFAEALGEALGSGNFDDLGNQLLSAFANFLSQFGQMLVALGIGQMAFVESLKTPAAAPMAIAAGIAMMVAAGAIRGLMSRGLSGSGSSSGGSSGGSMASYNPQTIKVEGVIRGKDIYITNRRYAEDNK
jgi:hypothetical protein